MERGAATRGKVAKAVAGADAIEIKATIPNHQIRDALRRFGLSADNDEERYIYFFDTPKLDLLDAGIITRARRVVGDAHDCTIKFRPINPGDVGAKWRQYRDFKIEADASEKSLVKSASFSMPAAKGLIKRVAIGKRPIAEIFTKDQQAFLMEIAGRKIDFSTLAVLGPLMASRWKFTNPACPWPITAELWRRADRQRLMEVSIKAPAVQAAVAVGGFMAFLAEFGAERDNNQQTKTRWALEYYASKLARKPAAAKAPAAKAPPKPRSKSAPKTAAKAARKRVPAKRRRPAKR
jgi:hypothetical protein